MRWKSSYGGRLQRIFLALGLALGGIGCGGAEALPGSSPNPAAAPAASRTANGQPILPSESTAPLTPAPDPAPPQPTAVPPSTATEALDPDRVVFEAAVDAGPPAPVARPAPPAPAPPANPPAPSRDDDEGDDDDDDEEDDD